MKQENTSIRLKKIMSDRHLRQVDILNLTKPYCQKYNVKMNKSDISQYVSGKNEPSQDKLVILGMALNVSESWLMGYDVEMERFDSDLLEKQKADRKALTQQWNIQFFEKKMLTSFSQLTDENKKKCISYTENLLTTQKMEEELLPVAAHSRTDIEATKEDIQRDLELMNDDNWE